MASLLGPFRVPQCSSCIRRMTASSAGVAIHGSRQQLRGKKTVAKDTTVKVKLLRNVERYGKKGAVIPIPAGRMRNDFFPNKKAEYVTKEQLQKLGLVGVTLERDTTFGTKIFVKTPELVKKEEQERKVKASVQLIQPDRAVKILEMLLPPNLDFYRTPIAVSAPAPRISPSIPSGSRISEEAAEAAAAAVKTGGSEKTSIYGSVTTADVAANLRAILAEDEEGARVVLGSEEVVFVEELEEQDRVKHLGVFEIEIRLKGAPLPVTRTIKVHAQE